MIPIMKREANDKPGPDHSAEARKPPNHPSEDAETPHKGAEVQPFTQIPESEAVSTPSLNEGTDKQKEAADDKPTAAETVTTRSTIVTEEKKAQPEAR